MCGFFPLPFASQVCVKVIGHEALEGGGEVAGDDLIVVNVEVLEYGLVEFAPRDVVGLLVMRVGRAEQCQAVFQVPGDVVFVELVGVQDRLGLCSGCRDSRLFTTKLWGVDGVGVERVENLLAVAVELSKPVNGLLPCSGCIGQDGLHVFEHEGPDSVDVSRPQCH